MSEQMVGYHCEQCETEFTKEKGFFVKDDEILCNCCMDSCHYIDENDVERAFKNAVPSSPELTDVGIWIRSIRCRYCNRDLGIEFKIDDQAYDNDNKKGNVNVVLGEAQ